MVDLLFLFKSGLVFATVCYVTSLLLKRYKLIKELSWASGPTALPILGNFFQLYGQNQAGTVKVLSKWHKKFGDTLVYWVGPDPVFLVSDPEIVQLLSNTGKFADKSIEYKFLETYIGFSSLLTAAGDTWYHKRRLLNPCFHTQILESFLETINNHGRNFLKYLDKYAVSKESFNFLSAAKLATLEVLMDTTMGIDLKLLDNEDHPYLHAIGKAREIVMARSYSIFLRNDLFFKFSKAKRDGDKAAATIRAFVNEVIVSKREKRKTEQKNGMNQDKGGRKALLDMFLDMVDAGNPIPDDEIENEINTFIFAGHDTTSVALSYVLYLLGRHPDIQEKLYNELMEIVPDFMETGLNQSDLNQLDYLNRCIKESLRMFAAVPLIGKILHEPLKTEKGIIPSGINITINIFNLHTNEKIYSNPHVFDPDRFLPENVAERVAHSFIPFATGMRNCIGQRFAMMELKILLSHILRNYKVESIDDPEDLQIGFELVLTPLKGIYLKLERRIQN